MSDEDHSESSSNAYIDDKKGREKVRRGKYTKNLNDLKELITYKLKDETFLEMLYQELALVADDPSELPNLTHEDITTLIIKFNLFHKILAKTEKFDNKEQQRKQIRAHQALQRGTLNLKHASSPQRRKYAIPTFRYPKSKELYETYMRDPSTTTTGFTFSYCDSDLQLSLYLDRIKNFDFGLDSESMETRECDLFINITFHNESVTTRPLNLTNNIAIDQSLKIKFKGDFVDKDDGSINENLVKLKSPLRITLYLKHRKSLVRELVSVKELEWRYILAYNDLSLNVELPRNTGTASRIGLLKMELSLESTSKRKPKRLRLIKEKRVEAQLDKEKKDSDFRILAYNKLVKLWWEEFKELNPRFARRSVKVYNEDLFGCLKLAPFFVQPLRSRSIESPAQAARFVSLIPFEDTPVNNSTLWYDNHTFLMEGKGDAFKHALLLASLFVGFEVDAYVVIGSSTDGAHAWVLTREVGGRKGAKGVCRFWESLTGVSYDVADPRVGGLYRRVGCVFSDKTFYANIQDNDLAEKMSFDLENRIFWKELENYNPEIHPRFDFQIKFTKNTKKQIHQKEREMELDLKLKITEYKHFSNFSLNRFNDDLGHLLGSILTKYEVSQSSGGKVDSSELISTLRNHVEDDYIFKAFPIQLKTLSCDVIFDKIKTNPTGRNVLDSKGDQLNFAIRVKVVPFPEDIYVVWVILAAYYIEVDTGEPFG